MSGNIDEDILELLRHAACRSAYRTQEIGKLVTYFQDIRWELKLGDTDDIIGRIRSLRQHEVKFHVLQEHQKVLNATVVKMRE